MARITRLLAILLAVAAFATFAAMATGLTGVLRRDAIAGPAVATVNGRAIPRSDLDERTAELLPLASFHRTVDEARRRAIARSALDQLVVEELIYQDAVARGATAGAAEVDAEVARARDRFSSDGEYEEALAENRLTEATYRARLARVLTIARAKRARGVSEPTETELREYFEANRAKFTRPERVHLLEMLVRVDPSDPASSRSAERRAGTLARRLAAGEPFGQLARAASEDEYRVKDGDLGWVHRGRLDAELEAAVFAAPLGRTAVARSLYGFHVFRVAAREPETALTFDDARPLIVDRLRRARADAAERAWHARLRQTAHITILDLQLERTRPADLPPIDRRPGPGRFRTAPGPGTGDRTDG